METQEKVLKVVECVVFFGVSVVVLIALVCQLKLFDSQTAFVVDLYVKVDGLLRKDFCR